MSFKDLRLSNPFVVLITVLLAFAGLGLAKFILFLVYPVFLAYQLFKYVNQVFNRLTMRWGILAVPGVRIVFCGLLIAAISSLPIVLYAVLIGNKGNPVGLGLMALPVWDLQD